MKEDKLLVVTLNQPSRFFTLNNIRIKDPNSCRCKSYSNVQGKTFSYFNEITKSIEKISFRAKVKPVNVPVKKLPAASVYSIDYSHKRKSEIVYISNYSIINIEQLEE